MVVKVWKLGLMSFDTANKIQSTLARKLLDAKKQAPNSNYDTLLLVEHKPVYTVGIRDDTHDVKINELKQLGAEFRKTNRGGLITFHGPGQLVAYPVLDLKHFRTSVKWYVNALEEVVIRLCDDLGVHAGRNPNTGVWVDDNKLASIGIHASRYVTTHGIALNCDNDLSWFEYIDACGLYDAGVTSLTNETGVKHNPDKVIPQFIRTFSKVFGCETEELENDVKEEVLNKVYSKLVQDKDEADVKQ